MPPLSCPHGPPACRHHSKMAPPRVRRSSALSDQFLLRLGRPLQTSRRLPPPPQPPTAPCSYPAFTRSTLAPPSSCLLLAITTLPEKRLHSKGQDWRANLQSSTILRKTVGRSVGRVVSSGLSPLQHGTATIRQKFCGWNPNWTTGGAIAAANAATPLTTPSLGPEREFF